MSWSGLSITACLIFGSFLTSLLHFGVRAAASSFSFLKVQINTNPGSNFTFNPELCSHQTHLDISYSLSDSRRVSRRRINVNFLFPISKHSPRRWRSKTAAASSDRRSPVWFPSSWEPSSIWFKLGSFLLFLCLCTSWGRFLKGKTAPSSGHLSNCMNLNKKCKNFFFI